MDAAEMRALQGPLKQGYRDNPDSAQIPARAEARLGAGVTLNSVATAMEIELRGAVVRAEGTWDARGTLGVSKEVPIGLTNIDLTFELDTDADEKTRTRLVELTERFCVIYQTLRNSPQMSYSITP